MGEEALQRWGKRSKERRACLYIGDRSGYALVEAKDVRGPGGAPGRELVFGHDEDNKPFVYRVRLFVIGDALLVLEAGGQRDQLARLGSSVDWMLDQVRIK